jgi:hypothetical protein
VKCAALLVGGDRTPQLDHSVFHRDIHQRRMHPALSLDPLPDGFLQRTVLGLMG